MVPAEKGKMQCRTGVFFAKTGIACRLFRREYALPTRDGEGARGRIARSLVLNSHEEWICDRRICHGAHAL